MDLYIVPNDTAKAFGAASLDGSPPGYWFTAATNASLKDTWVLFFDGGGWCFDEVHCAARSASSLGSSTLLNKTMLLYYGVVSPFPQHNALAGANRAILAYTDGASFSGMREDPVVYRKKTMWFRGFANLRSILQDLEDRHGMGTAKKVLVSGGSAGGLAAYIHAPYIASRFPQAATGSAPCSGYFPDFANAAGDLVYGNAMIHAAWMQNVTGSLNPACVAAQSPGEEWRCFMSPQAYAHSPVPTFVINSAWDSASLGAIFTASVQNVSWDSNNTVSAGLPGWESCGGDFQKCNSSQVGAWNGFADSLVGQINSTDKFHSPGNGAFVHSCIIHMASLGQDWASSRIGNVLFKDAFEAWWFGNFGGAGEPVPPTLQPPSDHSYLPECELHTVKPYACNPTCQGI